MKADVLDVLDTVAAYHVAQIDNITMLRDYAVARDCHKLDETLAAMRTVACADYNVLLAVLEDARAKGGNS